MARILVADPDPTVRDLLETRLDGSHQVTSVASGEDVLSTLDKGRIDIVVIDIVLEGIDGLEVLRRIRSSSDHSQLPVIILTARVAEDDYLQAWQGGADGYMSKPFEPDALEDLVAEVLTRGPERRKKVRERETDKATFLRRLSHRFG